MLKPPTSLAAAVLALTATWGGACQTLLHAEIPAEVTADVPADLVDEQLRLVPVVRLAAPNTATNTPALSAGLIASEPVLSAAATPEPRASGSLSTVEPTKVEPTAEAEVQSAVNDSLSEMVRQAIIENLPGDYTDNDDWGQTKDALHGFKIKTHDWHVKIQKRTKPVKHGLWKKYQVGVVDPERRLHVQIGTLRPVGPGRLAFQVALAADLHGEARVERWRQGVKMLNFSAEADSRVQVLMDCEVGFRLVPGKFLSDIVIEPLVKNIDIKLVELDVQRVSKIDGLAAHEIGNALKDTIAEQLAKRGPKIATKINKSIDKRRDKLRFSPDQFVSSGWSKLQNKLGFQPTEGDATLTPK